MEIALLIFCIVGAIATLRLLVNWEKITDLVCSLWRKKYQK